MIYLGFAAITVLLGAWVISPLFRKEDFSAGEGHLEGELKDLHALKTVAYDTLRDLDFDFRMGKMADQDYQDLKAQYQREAAEIMARIETVEKRLDQERPPGQSRRLTKGNS